MFGVFSCFTTLQSVSVLLYKTSRLRSLILYFQVMACYLEDVGEVGILLVRMSKKRVYNCKNVRKEKIAIVSREKVQLK